MAHKPTTKNRITFECDPILFRMMEDFREFQGYTQSEQMNFLLEVAFGLRGDGLRGDEEKDLEFRAFQVWLHGTKEEEANEAESWFKRKISELEKELSNL